MRDILERHRVYFARASELNDQDDLRPIIKIRPQPTDELKRAMILEAAEGHWAVQSPRPTPAHIERNRQGLRTEPIADLERGMAERTWKRLDSHYPIFCLSTRRYSPRMWKVYADSAAGVCVHFSSVFPSPFALCQKVHYEPERAIVWVPLAESEREVARCATLVKTRRWRHESEFRFVRCPGVTFLEIDFHVSGQRGEFLPKCVTGVTIGRAMPKEATVEIFDMARCHNPPLPVWRVQRNVFATPDRLL